MSNTVHEWVTNTRMGDVNARICGRIRGWSLGAKVHALRELQAQTRAELEALLPSVLDRAFRGEL